MMSGTLFLIGEIVLYLVAATLIGVLLGRLTTKLGSTSGRREATSLRRKTAALEAEVDRLEAALTTAKADAARAADTGELEARAAMAEREAEGLDRRLREASERLAALQMERDELVERLEFPGAPTDTGVVDSLEQRLGEASERIAALEAERNALADRLETIELVERPAALPAEAIPEPDDEEMAELRSELHRRRAEIARLERVAADAARLEEELAVRNHRIGDLEARLEATAASQPPGDATAASIGVSMGAGNYADSRLEFEAWDAGDA
jgi:chromosome segregation ATPase